MGFLWLTPTHLEQLLVKYQSTKALHPRDSGSMSQDGTVVTQGHCKMWLFVLWLYGISRLANSLWPDGLGS